jgi:hypothetical protein
MVQRGRIEVGFGRAGVGEFGRACSEEFSAPISIAAEQRVCMP